MSASKNSNDLAFPLAFVHDRANGPPYLDVSPGVTKREYFAGLAMQGLLADPRRGGEMVDYAFDAVKAADALLEELEEKVKNERS